MQRFIWSRRLRFTLVFSLSCLLFLCTSLLNVSPTKAQKTLTVAIDLTYPPFEVQGKNGEPAGFDVDLINAIAKAANFQIKFQSVPFEGMIPALQAKTVDTAVGAMGITAERSKTISFSRPYFKGGLAIVVKADTKDITSLESLKNKRVAVQIGTTSAEKAKKIVGAKIHTLDTTPLVLQELLNGNVDAVINDVPVILYAIKTNNLDNKVKIAGKPLTEDYYGIPTPKNSPDLDAINQGLTTILSNGTYEQIYQKWFGVKPPQLPATLTFDNSNGSVKVYDVILSALPNLLRGALVTLELTAFSVFLGMVAGSLIGIVRLSKVTPLRWLTRAYIDFFRGTPLLVQIFMIYFGIPALLQGLGVNFNLNRLAAAVAALSLNSAAYIAEIVRAGIQSIEKGQSEAAESLGLSSSETMRYVIFPQALRRMLPALGNEFISLLKDTSLVAVIGFEELFRRGQLIVADNYRAFEIYATVALIYLTLTLLASRVFGFLEHRMNPVNKEIGIKKIKP